MVKSVWITQETIKAESDGFEAAIRRLPRVPRTPYTTDNERAAFIHGWDKHSEALRIVRSAIKVARGGSSRQQKSQTS